MTDSIALVSKKKIIIIWFFGVFMLFYNHSFAQDPQFSQFYAGKLTVAPSFAGTTDGSRVSLQFRDQWPLIPKEYITFMAAFDQSILKLNTGLGLVAMRDQAGDGRLSTTSVSLLYAYHVRLSSKLHFRPGLKYTLTNRSIDFTKFTFGDQLSVYGNRAFTSDDFLKDFRGRNKPYNVFFSDFGASALFYSPYFFSGISFDHLGATNASLVKGFYRPPIKMLVFGGMKFITNKGLRKIQEENVSISFLYRKQGKNDQMDIGLFWDKNPLVFGFWYRGLPGLLKSHRSYVNQDAIVALLGFHTKEYRIGYSYDFTISRLLTNTGGAHEISLTFLFNQNQSNRKKKPRPISCPDF